jgi:hypothetical protein
LRKFTLEEVTATIAVSEPQHSMEWYTFAQGHDLDDVLRGGNTTGEVHTAHSSTQDIPIL